MKHVLLVVAALWFAGCSRSDPETQPPATSAKASKDPEMAKRLIAEGAVAIDVRSPDEYRGGHLPSATNIPVDEIGTRIADVDTLVGADRTKPVVVYCAKGGRAAKAKQALEQAGFQRVVNGGGLDDLQ